jgi:CheY-like chemotaxis protein
MQHSSTLPRKIFVVDDGLGAREALSELLVDSGYSVSSASNGREALIHLRNSSPPSVIILDLMMPLMDGWEFLEHQSHDPALLDIPVLVLSGTPHLHPVSAKAVLLKPVCPKELFKTIERFLPSKS